MFKNKIYNIDCLKLINKLIYNKKKVDHIITDPPYNISRKNNFKTINRFGIDFGKWDESFDQYKWLSKINKIIKKGGNVIIFNDWKNLGNIARYLQKKGFLIKDILRWSKLNPMPRNAKRRYINDGEYAIWLTYGKNWTFNNGGKYIRCNFIDSIPAKRIHPTQKSKKVIKEIIKIHTNKEDLIFDPFAGSAEISAMSLKLKRNFLASEIDRKYINEIYKRKEFNNENFIPFVRPVYNHLGNKFKLIEEIIKNIPKDYIFIEVFSGTGIISANIINNQIILNDLKHVSNINKLLIFRKPKTLIKKLKELNISDSNTNKEHFLLNRNKYNKNFNIYTLLWLIINGFNQQIRFNSKGCFNIPIGKQSVNKNTFRKIIKFHNAFSFKNVKIYNKDFKEFVNLIISKYSNERKIIYFDPPYFLSNATYNYEWTKNDEIDLYKSIEKLINSKIPFIMSNLLRSKGKINTFLKDFIKKNKKLISVVEIKKTYSNSNYQRKKYSEDFEVLIKYKY